MQPRLLRAVLHMGPHHFSACCFPYVSAKMGMMALLRAQKEAGWRDPTRQAPLLLNCTLGRPNHVLEANVHVAALA